MDVNKMLTELREEREQIIEEAILSLERLARGRGKRRGRPPAWLAQMRQESKDSQPPKKAASKKAAKPQQPTNSVTAGVVSAGKPNGTVGYAAQA